MGLMRSLISATGEIPRFIPVHASLGSLRATVKLTDRTAVRAAAPHKFDLAVCGTVCGVGRSVCRAAPCGGPGARAWFTGVPGPSFSLALTGPLGRRSPRSRSPVLDAAAAAL
jgi:hypothetical protein